VRLARFMLQRHLCCALDATKEHAYLSIPMEGESSLRGHPSYSVRSCTATSWLVRELGLVLFQKLGHTDYASCSAADPREEDSLGSAPLWWMVNYYPSECLKTQIPPVAIVLPTEGCRCNRFTTVYSRTAPNPNAARLVHASCSSPRRSSCVDGFAHRSVHIPRLGESRARHAAIRDIVCSKLMRPRF